MAIKFRAGNRMRGSLNDKNAFNRVVVGAIFEDEDTENTYEWNGTVWNFKEGSFASTDSKPSNAKTKSTITESDTENKYRYDGTNWKFTGRGKLASSATKPTQAETNSIITEIDTDNRYIYDGTNWSFTGRGKLASSVTKPTVAKTNSMITETDTDNTYKFDGTNWNLTGDGRFTSGQTKPTNAVSGATILETDTLTTYDFNGSAWVARASGGGAISGGTMSFPHSTTDDDYTKTGTITFSNFNANDNESDFFNAGSIGPAQQSGSSGSWSSTSTVSLSDIYVKQLKVRISYSLEYGTGNAGISDVTITFTDGTTQTCSRSEDVTLNKQVNRLNCTFYGAPSRRSGGIYWSSSTQYTTGNIVGDINAEKECATSGVGCSIENSCGTYNLFGADINNGALNRTTCTSYKVEVWNGSAWVRVRTLGNTLGKMRWNGINGSKIKITALDAGDVIISIDKFRIYKKVDADMFNHGHTEIDPNETLGLDGS